MTYNRCIRSERNTEWGKGAGVFILCKESGRNRSGRTKKPYIKCRRNRKHRVSRYSQKRQKLEDNPHHGYADGQISVRENTLCLGLKAYASTTPRAQVSARILLKKFWPKSRAVREKHLLMDFLDMFKAECTVLECRTRVQCEYSTDVSECDSLP